MLDFQNFFDVGDIIALATFLALVISGFFALYQWRKKVKKQKADYINELTKIMRNDPEIKEVIYLIEYGKEPWYNPKFHGSELEPKVDKALSFFSYICYLKHQKIISTKEFCFFKYLIHRFLINSNVKKYLEYLHEFSNFTDSFSFLYLYDYGVSQDYFNE